MPLTTDLGSLVHAFVISIFTKTSSGAAPETISRSVAYVSLEVGAFAKAEGRGSVLRDALRECLSGFATNSSAAAVFFLSLCSKA